MKNWGNYFFLHMAMAWSLGLYLFLVLVVGQFAISFMPFFKIQTGIIMQLIAFVPFYLSVPSMMAEKTGDYFPVNADYYTAFGISHFPTLVTLLSFALSYVKLKMSGIQDILVEEVSKMTQYHSTDGGLFDFFMSMLLQFPVALIEKMDDVLLYLGLYLLGYLFMVVALERRRLKLIFQKI